MYGVLLQESLSFSFNFTDANKPLVDKVVMRVAALNNFALGPFSEFVYLGEPALGHPLTTCIIVYPMLLGD